MALNSNEELLNALHSIAESNNAQDTFMIAVMIVGVAVYIVKSIVLPMMDKRKYQNGKGDGKDPHLANNAHAEILREDKELGIPVIRAMPHLIREGNKQVRVLLEDFTKQTRRLADATEKLANHNASRLDQLYHELLHRKDE